MDFDTIIEITYFDLVLEGLGVIFGFHLLWNFLFQDTLPYLLSLFIHTIC